MASIGKLVAAAGGLIVAVFSLIAMIVVLSGFGTTGYKVNAVFQGLIMVGLGVGLVAGAMLAYERLACGLGCVALVVVFLASILANSVLLGSGVMFYVVLGGLIAATGACWSRCLAVCCARAADAAVSEAAPPESKL